MKMTKCIKKGISIFLLQFYFMAYGQSLIINELMINPSGGTLPPFEYVELYNAGDQPINLKDYLYQVGTQSIQLPAYFLAPKQFIILVDQKNQAEFDRFGNVIGLSRWFILNNTRGTVSLHTLNRQVVDSVAYTNRWYQDTDKARGGWSLERINPELSCQLEANWKASNDFQGGTPAKQNSLYQKNFTPALDIKNIQVKNNEVFIAFNQNVSNYLSIPTAQMTISPKIGVAQQSEFIAPDTLRAIFATAIGSNEPYELSLENALFCEQQLNLKKTIFIADEIAYNDVVINEVLFNPRADGADFVEIYNRSNAIINLQNWFLGNRIISDQLHLFRPKEFRVLTNDRANILLNYPSAVQENIIEMSIPRYGNEQGIVTLFNAKTLIDSLYYTSAMHHPFLQNPKGISLERKDADSPTNMPNAFTSAATLSEGATPGYQNSKNKDAIAASNNFVLTSKTFSPDGDAHEDVLEIKYKLDDNNYMINFSVFNDAGNLINRLIRNQSINSEGVLYWDGNAENNQPAKAGIYLYYIELYTAEGYFKTFKNSFFLVRSARGY